MKSYLEALAIIRESGRTAQSKFLNQTEFLSVEPLDVQALISRISAEDVLSTEAIPPFDNSSMDGFALRSEWVQNASKADPVLLRVIGTTFAGEDPGNRLSQTEATCLEIMTGAPLPEGADAVVKIEDVERIGDQIKITQFLRPTENVRKSGTDFHSGQRLLRLGARISAEHILGFATVGKSEIKVLKRPKVALISTGNELVEKISDSLSGGMIRNSTAPYLMSVLPFFGAEGKYYGLVRDNAESFKDLIKAVLLDKPDVILTTGAVSKGKLDFVPDAFRDLGVEIKFHGLKIRPGKPLLFAQFTNGPAVFAVPGNPISTAVALRFFISSYLHALQGLADEKFEQAILQGDTEKAEGLTCFWKSVVEAGVEGTKVTSLTGQESYRVSSLMPANAWIVLPEVGDVVPNQTVVQTLPLYPKTIFENEIHEGDCC